VSALSGGLSIEEKIYLAERILFGLLSDTSQKRPWSVIKTNKLFRPRFCSLSTTDVKHLLTRE
jgi:hypothetical protein